MKGKEEEREWEWDKAEREGGGGSWGRKKLFFNLDAVVGRGEIARAGVAHHEYFDGAIFIRPYGNIAPSPFHCPSEA